ISLHSMSRAAIASFSSGKTEVWTTLKPAASSARATAGPEMSSRLRRKEESLIVITDAVFTEAGVTLCSLGFQHVLFAVAIGLIEEPQALQQQALRGLCGGLLAAVAGKIDLETSRGPGEDLVNSAVAFQFAIKGVIDLAFGKVHLAFVAIVGQRE